MSYLRRRLRRRHPALLITAFMSLAVLGLLSPDVVTTARTGQPTAQDHGLLATCTPLTFDAPTVHPTSVYPINMVVEDFNADGKSDMAVLSYPYGQPEVTVSVSLGDGIGGFSAPVNFAVGRYAQYIKSADFNKDGKPDLAVANSFEKNILIMLGDGAGGFLSTTATPGNIPDPFYLEVGDFNSDGNPDLVVPDSGLITFSILLGDGAGGFGPATRFFLQYRPYAVAVGDFNSDGKLDLAFMCEDPYYKAVVSLVLGSGTGSFGTESLFPAGDEPTAITTSDFNRDGKLDVALAHYSPNLTILSGTGTGSFSAPVSHPSVGFASALTTGDLDGDGKLDLVASNQFSNVLSLLQGLDGGGFSPPTTLTVSGGPRFVAVHDLNNDGRLDLAAPIHDSNTDSGVALYLNTTQCGLFISGRAKDVRGVGVKGATVTLTDNTDTNAPAVVLTTDSSGSYRFNGVAQAGNYTVRTQASGVQFESDTLIFTLTQSIVTADFVVNGPLHTISGVVRDAADNPLSGVTVNLSGYLSQTAVTDTAGAYAFIGLRTRANFTTTPVLPGTVFNPVSRQYNPLVKDQTGANFRVGACAYSLNPTSLNDVGSNGTTGTINVTTAADCLWTATSHNPDFIVITSAGTGTGSGAVGFRIVTNVNPARSGTITVADQTFTVSQVSGCTYSFYQAGYPHLFSNKGGTESFDLNTGGACPWTAVSSVPWITLAGSGTGSGPVNFTVAPNAGPPRNGEIILNDGQRYFVQQATGLIGNARTVGVFRQSNGIVYLKNQNTGGFSDLHLVYGNAGDLPISGDWDGDGEDTLGIYRQGVFHLRNSNTTGPADLAFRIGGSPGGVLIGSPGDLPIAGDWNGDGVDNVGVYRQSTGVFYLRNSNTNGFSDFILVFGSPGDLPIVGDWNGDGITKLGVFRQSNGIIYLRNSYAYFDNSVTYLVYGNAGDKPVAGDWNGDGQDSIGIYRNGVFYLRNSNTQGFADLVFALGNDGDLPIAGDWDGLP